MSACICVAESSIEIAIYTYITSLLCANQFLNMSNESLVVRRPSAMIAVI